MLTLTPTEEPTYTLDVSGKKLSFLVDMGATYSTIVAKELPGVEKSNANVGRVLSVSLHPAPFGGRGRWFWHAGRWFYSLTGGSNERETVVRDVSRFRRDRWITPTRWSFTAVWWL